MAKKKPKPKRPGQMPGQSSGATYASRQAIGVPGKQIIDPNTGQVVGYQGYTAERTTTLPGGAYGDLASGGGYLPGGDFKETVAPRYFDGEQLEPANWTGARTDEMIALQEAMYAAGLYGDSSYTRGVWTSVDAAAYEELLSMSNQSGLDKDRMLDQIIKSGGMPKKGKAARAPLTIELSNPEDIRATLRQTAQQLYSGDLSPEQEEAFIASYQGMQASAQRQAYGMAETGGTVVGPPNVGVLAEAELRKAHPEQVFVSALGAQLHDIVSTIGQPGGGAL